MFKNLCIFLISSIFAGSAFAAQFTAGTVPVANSGTVIVDSVIYQSNSKIGVLNPSPIASLDVDGGIYSKGFRTFTPTNLVNTANYSGLTAMSASEYARSIVSAPYIISLQGLDGIKFLQGIPENLTSVVTKDSTNAISVVNYGRYTLIADANPGLRIYDSQDVFSPVLKSTIMTHRAWGVDSLGYYAYIADDYYNPRDFGVIDFSDPSNPSWVAGLGVNYNQSLEVVGKYVYDAANTDFTVIDITDPTAPTIAGTYNTTSARDLFTVGKYSYVADASAGFRILDISNPAAITQVGIYNTPGSAQGITCKKNLCYVADKASGLEVYDITNPASPVLKTTYSTLSDANDVQVKGNYAYVSTHDNGLQMLDIGGIKTPGITAGDVDTTDINVDHNVSVGNRLDVRNNITAGFGIHSGTEVFAQTKVVAMDKLSIGTPYPVNSISFGGTLDRDIAVRTNPTTDSAGKNLTLSAGSVTSGMVASVSIAVGHSDTGIYEVGDVLQLPAPPGGTSATLTVSSVSAPTAGNDVTGVTITTKGSGYTAGLTYPTFNLTDPAGTVMGCTITVNSVEYATNKAGGDLIISSGNSSGTGTSGVKIKTASAGSSGATNNTPTIKFGVEADGSIYTTTASAKLIMVSPDGSCSACGPDNADSWSCSSVACR